MNKNFSYVDHTVIAFLHRVQRLFEEGIAFALFTLLEPQQRSWSVIAQKIWPLLTPNISELRCCKRVYLHQLRRLVSPTVLCDCTKLRSIFGYNDLLPESPADDSDGASDGQALSKWLHTPREDGRQKMLCFRCRWDNRNACRLFSMVDQLMKTFLNASASVKYVIRLEWVHIFVAPFDLENERTRERLALRCKGKELLMKRGPIVGEVNEWTEWEREAVEWDWLRLNKNMVKITITDSSIG
uniref:CRAL-TRIO domain-containing protein n=1 Tax=Globodera pallida TaxID=36090 RepID=A0A183CNN5_GLOPA